MLLGCLPNTMPRLHPIISGGAPIPTLSANLKIERPFKLSGNTHLREITKNSCSGSTDSDRSLKAKAMSIYEKGKGNSDVH